MLADVVLDGCVVRELAAFLHEADLASDCFYGPAAAGRGLVTRAVLAVGDDGKGLQAGRRSLGGLHKHAPQVSLRYSPASGPTPLHHRCSVIGPWFGLVTSVGASAHPAAKWIPQPMKVNPRGALLAVTALALLDVAGVGYLVHRRTSQPPVLALPLRTVAEVPLPGSTSRFDYASIDAQTHRLFVAHLGNSEMLTIDTTTNRVVRRTSGLAVD